jgi:hypothetical protein
VDPHTHAHLRAKEEQNQVQQAMNYEPPRGAEWIATAVVFYVDAIGKALDWISSATSSKRFKTPEDVRSYARSIQHSSPSQAADLIAAANRHDNAV